jgi:starvation-inducible DNA-binding protein
VSAAKPVGPLNAPRLAAPTDLRANATKDIAAALNALLADTFAIYLKTKKFPLARKRLAFPQSRAYGSTSDG